MSYLGFLSIRHHIFDSLLRVGSQHGETHGQSGGLARHSIVLIQMKLELFVDVGALRAHAGQTQTQTAAVTDNFIGRFLQLLQQVVRDVGPVVGVDQAQSVQTTT